MFSIQWFDPYMPEAQQPYKDGKPRGKFATREEATERAEQLLEESGCDLPYEIVEIEACRA